MEAKTMSEYFDAADVAIALEEKEMDLYHTMRKAAQSSLMRIAELEAERDNAWTELREIRAAISANPEESTLDEVVKLRKQLAERDAEIAILKTVPMKYRRMAFNAELQEENAALRQQLSEAQAEALEQARIVGMGGEHEIALLQNLGIVSSLLREASGRMSYGHWSTEFRARVESALKTKEPKP